MPSGNGYRVRLTLRELGIPFQLREVDILKGETRQPWFLAKNPIGQIPVLELEDGTCLTESAAILFHLARGTSLRGRQLVGAAEAHLRGLGCRKINAQTHTHNEAGVRFWESVGYEREARTSLGKDVSR